MREHAAPTKPSSSNVCGGRKRKRKRAPEPPSVSAAGSTQPRWAQIEFGSEGIVYYSRPSDRPTGSQDSSASGASVSASDGDSKGLVGSAGRAESVTY